MKILQINCVYAKGSTGKIVESLHHYYLRNGMETCVIYGRGDRVSEENVVKYSNEMRAKIRNAISRLSGNIYGYGLTDTKKILAHIDNIHPDIVHIHCINGFFCNVYALIEGLKKRRINTVITLHAEFMYTGSCGYAFDCNQWINGCEICPTLRYATGGVNGKAPHLNWERMRNAFLKFENVRIVGVSPWISDRAKSSEIMKNFKITYVLNGVNTNIFSYSQCQNCFTSIKDSGEKIILHVTPYFEDENKGGKWVIDLAKRINNYPIKIVVAGKHSKNYEFDNIVFLGEVSDQKMLASLYSSSDIVLLTSRRETFSMITAEALCCGTPVVGFKAGAPETIAIEQYCTFVEYGDIDALTKAVLNWLSISYDKLQISKDAKKKYSVDTMSENYISIYREMIEANGKCD